MRAILFLFLLFISNFVFNLQAQIKILPLGNSITFDNRYKDFRPIGERISYRYKLFQLLNTAGYSFDFVGTENSGGDYFGDTQNGGFPGITPEGLRNVLINQHNSYVNNWTNRPSIPYLNHDVTYGCEPTAILLHIGTNGLTSSNYNAYVNNVSEILNQIDLYSADVVVFLAQIIKPAIGTDASPTQNYNVALNTMAQQRISSLGDKIVVVNMETGAGIDYRLEGDGGDMADELHPNTSGYNKMAQKWYDALETYNLQTPVMSAIPNQTVAEGSSFLTVKLDDFVSDPQDADADITWSIVPAVPQYLNVTIDGSRIATITPKDANWNGSETITFKATDSGNGGVFKCATKDVVFTVTPVNDPPVIVSQKAITINEDNSYLITLSDLVVTDVDNSQSSLTLFVQDGTNYTRVSNTITPVLNFNGTLSVPVKVFDGAVYSSTFNVQVSVALVNDLPVITGQNPVSVNEDATVSIALNNIVVSDLDNTYPVGFSLKIFGGTNYTISGNIVSPKKDFNGNLTVPVKVYDGKDSSNRFNLVLSVTPVNDLPKLTLPLLRTVYTDSTYNQSLLYSDVDNDPLTISLINAPAWITINNGVLSGTPHKTDFGLATFTVRLSDGKVNIDSIMNIDVLISNYPPDITSTPILTSKEGVRYEYDLQVADENSEDIVYMFAVQKPNWLNFVQSNGLLYGTPVNANVGKFDIKLLATDGLDSTFQTFTITVENVNDIPIISSQKNLLSTKAGVPLEILVTDIYINDPDNLYPADFTIEVLSGANYTFSGATVTPLSAFKGNLLVGIRVTDGKDYSSSYNLSVSVLPTAISTIKSGANSFVNSLYPIPAKDFLNIEFTQEQQAVTVVLIDLMGKIVNVDFVNTDNIYQINLSDLNSGVYILKIACENGSYSKKVIVLKD